ncbi:unnamed protein product [Ceratitis capitata]|uniref:pyridoxal 5'-phosphate synthase n=1 Tax=Ceratitis capitata TaxID=7213 RepID=A0A811UPT6_CERCA|nr:unnamed protein product [Ceratitis capitata]
MRVPVIKNIDDVLKNRCISNIERRDNDTAVVMHLGMSGKLIYAEDDRARNKHDHAGTGLKYKECERLATEIKNVLNDAITAGGSTLRNYAQPSGSVGCFQNEPTAMTLATCSKDCIPSARVVLLKEYGEKGFTFFTNVNSRKGRELTENPKAALVFHWIEFSRQVRIEGDVKLLDGEQAATGSMMYFVTKDPTISTVKLLSPYLFYKANGTF